MVAEVQSPSPRVLVPVMAPARDGKNVLVAVPALNEERFIGSVVHEVRLRGFDCLVVDDGSSDRTSAIAAAAGAIVERHDRNRGKAAAVNTAFEAARRAGVSILVVIDGDFQHDPGEIKDLIEPIRSGDADLVSGSRFLPSAGGHVPGLRAMGMRALTRSTSLVSGQRMTDSLSGYRAFGRSAIEAFRFKSDGFAVEFEMQFMAQRHGLKHLEVPITARYLDPPRRNVFLYGLQTLDGLIRLAIRFRPLPVIGLPSAAALLAGVLLGFAAFDTYRRTATFDADAAFAILLLIVFGSLGIFTSVLLHVLRGYSQDIEDRLASMSPPPGAGAFTSGARVDVSDG